MSGDKVAHPLFLGTGERDQRPRVESAGGGHGAQAVEIRIYVGGDDVHTRFSWSGLIRVRSGQHESGAMADQENLLELFSINLP
jgi:hypothetical protein